MQPERKPCGYKPLALDGGYGWVVVFGSFLIHVFADGFVYSFGVIAESLIKEFNSTNTEVSTILSLLTGLMLAAGPIASAVCNRIGCRITTIIGASIASFGCALSYFANSMLFLIISVGIIMGIGFGLMYCPAIVIVTIYFEKYRSLATGVTVCGAGVGTFMFSKVIGILIVEFNWRTVFLIYAAVVLLCVPCGALYRPVEFVPVYEDEDEEEESDGGSGAENEKQLQQHDGPVHENGDAVGGGITPKIEGRQNGKAATAIGCSLDNVQQQQPQQTTRTTMAEDQQHQQQQHEPLRAAHSHQQINKVDSAANGGAHTDMGLLQRFFSIGDHLNVSQQQQQRNKQHAHHHHHHGTAGGAISISTGYLNVRDVFYPGSITELPEYKENRSRFRSVSSLHSTTARGIASSVLQVHSADIRRIEEEKEDDEVELEQRRHATPPVLVVDDQVLVKKEESEEMEEEEAAAANRAIEVWRTVKRMLDLSLLANPIYLLFGISNFLTSIGFNAPPMFMPMNAEIVLGWDKMQASSTVSAYGLANTFGRIAFGLICDRRLPTRWGKDRARNRLWIYNLTLVACGLLSCFVFAMTSHYAFLAYSFAFGFTISSYVCLTSVVLVDLVGVDRLTNAFGLLLFIQGIATFVGPPLAGKLYDLTLRYDWTFAFCGVCLFISGAMLFVIPWMQKTENAGEKMPGKEMMKQQTTTTTTTIKLNSEAQGLINEAAGNGGKRRRSYEAV